MASARLPVPMVVLVGLLVVWEPLTFALTASAALARLAQFGAPALLLLAYRALVVSAGIAVGRALWARDPAAPRAARVWVIFHALATVLTFTTPYFPSNRPPSTKGRMLAVLVSVDAGWWVWLTCSPAVRRTYRHER